MMEANAGAMSLFIAEREHRLEPKRAVVNRLLTTALVYKTPAGVDHSAATGIDHMKATAIIHRTAVAAIVPVITVRFTDIGFIVGHSATSFI